MLTSYQSTGQPQSSGDIVIRQLNEKVADLENRLLKIEKTPVSATQVIVERELDEPAIRVIADRKNGEVYGV